MQPGQQPSRADQVRRYVLEHIVEPARSSGRKTVTVRAGDVQRGLGWWNLVPSVCSALDAQEFARMSRTRLIDRRGPRQSTTSEWHLDLAETAGSEEPVAPRRLVATWDGEVFRPVVIPEEFESGSQVVLMVHPVSSVRDLAGPYADLMGTMTQEDAAEMEAAMEEAFETISDDW